MRRPLIIAHRGASAHAPENTLAAFRMAIDAGADGVELDVQLSKDGVPVLFHDDDLRRIAKIRTRVRDLTASGLASVDVGAWFDRRRRMRKFAGETIPTLEAVLDVLDGFRGRIYVELKYDRTNFRELSRAAAEVLRASHLLTQVIVKSFHLETLLEIKSILPDVQTAALFAPQLRKRSYIELARKGGTDQLSLHYSLATMQTCSRAKDAGLPVTVWTVDNPRWIERCHKRGIAALITNDPAKMLAARNSLLS